MSATEHDVAHIDDLGAGGMHQIECDGEKILLLRDGDDVRALAANCPHAGAPLAEGVRHGDRLICPWHKAAFCVRTGRVLDPPAVDPLQCYDVRLDGGRILLTKAGQAKPAERVAEDPRCFVIVGAGAAGAVAAQTLREGGFAGRIVMLDRQNRVPYDRTILSKYSLSGKKGAEKSPLQSQAWYQAHNIERRTAEVVRIDESHRRITCADGTALVYDAALLATGATPSWPGLKGGDLDGVFTLRSREDAEAILAQAERSARATILGASFIGMEVAASLRERGLEVTVIGQESAPFEKQLGAEIGHAFVGLHKKRGVSFRFNAGIAALEGTGQVSAVRLASGEAIPADLVVIGFGVKPVTGFAEGVPRNDDGGIKVDSYLRISDGLYAAGDIASFPLLGDGPPTRVEHWRVAQQHGRVAALNMLGQTTRYDAVPVFWTIQYMKRLDYIGHAEKWDRLIIHGDLSAAKFLAYYCLDGEVVAAAGMDRDQDTAALIELFGKRRGWRADELGECPLRVLEATPPAIP